MRKNRKIMRNRKAQMELIGIALVVVLIVFGFLFFLGSMLKPAKKEHEQFAKIQLAKNMLNAIVNTKTQCNNLDFMTVLEDCATRERLDCSGRTSCEVILQDLGGVSGDDGVLDMMILFPSLADGYRWQVQRGSPGRTTGIVNGLSIEKYCAPNADIEAAHQPIPVQGNTITIAMELCTNK